MLHFTAIFCQNDVVKSLNWHLMAEFCHIHVHSLFLVVDEFDLRIGLICVSQDGDIFLWPTISNTSNYLQTTLESFKSGTLTCIKPFEVTGSILTTDIFLILSEWRISRGKFERKFISLVYKNGRHASKNSHKYCCRKFGQLIVRSRLVFFWREKRSGVITRVGFTCGESWKRMVSLFVLYFFIKISSKK